MKNFKYLALIAINFVLLHNSKAQTISDSELFGPNVYIFSPNDDMNIINSIVNTAHDAMLHDEFSSKRYAFYFKPGDYTQAGLLDRKSTRLNSSHLKLSRMPSSA